MNKIIIYNIILFYFLLINILQFIKINNMFEPVKRNYKLRFIFQKQLLNKIKKRNPNLIFNDKFIKRNYQNINLNTFELPKNKKWIFYIHGNKFDVLQYYKFVNKLLDIGNILLYDYRGYGLSDGIPSPRGCIEDTIFVWRYFLKNKGISTKDCIFYGNSLGGGIAVKSLLKLIEKKESIPKGLLLESTFTSIKNMGKKRYPALVKVFGHLTYDTFNNENNLKKIINYGYKNITISHSIVDEIIPYTHSLELSKIDQNITHITIEGEHGDENIDSKYLLKIKDLF